MRLLCARHSVSAFEITGFSVSPTGILITWTDFAIRSYTVEKSTSMTAGSWSPVSGIVWPVTGNSILLPTLLRDRQFRITVKDPVHVHDIQATLLHCLGFDHELLTYRTQGRDFRLTDIHGRVIREVLA